MKKFAFLVHPRDISDVARPLPWTKYIPPFITDNTIKRLKGRPGFIVWSKINVRDQAEGWIIFVSLTGEQIMTLPRGYVQKRILDAVLYAQEDLGADIVGLGAYTAPITDAGRWLVRQDKVRLAVTHGDAYSVAAAFEGVEKVAKTFHRFLGESKVAIVGAYGLIGKALSYLVAQKAKSLVVIGRNQVKLDALCQTLASSPAEVVSSLKIEDVKDCDIIITATSYSKALIQPEHLKEKAIVYDIAQPINLYPEVQIKRPDVIRVDGCYIAVPGVDIKIDMGPPPGATFSCLAETMLQTLEGDLENHVGEIAIDHVERTGLWAKKNNFSHAPLTNFSKPI